MKKIVISLMVSVLLFPSIIHSQNFWQQTNGPYNGATVNDFLHYNDSIIFLATDEGIIESSDNGETWERIYTSKIKCLAADKTGVLYAAENYSSDNFYLLKSTNEGITWNRMNINIWPDIRQIMIPYKDTIFIATDNYGVCRSTDNGNTWLQINNGINYTKINKIILLSNGELLVGTNGGGVYKSTDEGESWIQHNSGIPPFSTGYIFVRTFCEFSPSEIIIGAQNEIYYSSNYGETWTERSEGFGVGIVNCVIKNAKGILYIGSSGYFKGVHSSSDNGNHWNTIGLNYAIFSFGLTSDSILYAGTLSEGLYKFSAEDSSWSQIYNQGFTPTEVTRLALTENNNIIAGTYWNGIHLSTNEGLTWNRTNYEGYEAYWIESINDSIIIAGSANSVYVSHDTGFTWAKTFDGYLYETYYDSVDQKIYLGGRSGDVYLSIDFGKQWNHFTTIPGFDYIHSIYVTKRERAILIAVLNTTNPPSIKVLKSRDQGNSWDIIFDNVFINEFIDDISGNIYALGEDSIYISENEGETWFAKDLPGSYADFITFDNSNEILFLGFYNKLSYSTDKGYSWLEMEYSGLYDSWNDIQIDKNNKIYLATDGGVYTGQVENILVSVNDKIPNSTYLLSQNYPNPFNPSTRIQYAISSTQFVTLKVYDLLGREVATLVNEEKLAGSYNVEFGMQKLELSSGIYFYKLQAGSFVETKKMILLK